MKVRSLIAAVSKDDQEPVNILWGMAFCSWKRACGPKHTLRVPLTSTSKQPPPHDGLLRPASRLGLPPTQRKIRDAAWQVWPTRSRALGVRIFPYRLPPEGVDLMLMAHPAVLIDLVQQYETLRALNAAEGSGDVRRRMNDVSYSLCIATGTADVDAALIAARHQLPGARPEDDSLLAA